MDATAWFERGRDLGCFQDDASQVAYLLAWRRGDVATVKSLIASVFSGPYPLHLVNSGSFGLLYERFERCDDGPDLLPEDWRESDFSVIAHDGTALSCAWLTEGGTLPAQASLDCLLTVLVRGLALAPSTAAKKAIVLTVRDEIVAVTNQRRSSLSALCRAATGSALFGSATASPALESLVPERESLALLSPGLRTRAGRVTGLWRRTLRAAKLGESAPISHEALAGCATTAQLASVLSAAKTSSNHNLLTYLSAADA